MKYFNILNFTCEEVSSCSDSLNTTCNPMQQVSAHVIVYGVPKCDVNKYPCELVDEFLETLQKSIADVILDEKPGKQFWYVVLMLYSI